MWDKEAKRAYERKRRKLVNYKIYMREYCRRKLLELKIDRGAKCEICGQTDIRTLVWHHKSNKTMSIGKLFRSRKREELKKELKSCILICANCHAILHYSEEMR